MLDTLARINLNIFQCSSGMFNKSDCIVYNMNDLHPPPNTSCSIKLFLFYLQVWDDELALIALTRARQCPNGHESSNERAAFST